MSTQVTSLLSIRLFAFLIPQFVACFSLEAIRCTQTEAEWSGSIFQYFSFIHPWKVFGAKRRMLLQLSEEKGKLKCQKRKMHSGMWIVNAKTNCRSRWNWIRFHLLILNQSTSHDWICVLKVIHMICWFTFSRVCISIRTTTYVGRRFVSIFIHSASTHVESSQSEMLRREL